MFRKCANLFAAAVAIATAAPALGGVGGAEALLAKGEAALLAGDLLPAEVAFTSGMDRYPEDARFAYYAGIVAFLDGRHDDAIARLARARRAYPEASLYMGLAELDRGDPEAARPYLKAFLKHAPRDPQGLLFYGIVLTYLRNPAAVGHLNRAARLAKELRTPALFFRGLAQVALAQKEAADKALKAVIRLEEDPRMVTLARAARDLLHRKGDVAKRSWGEVWTDLLWDDNLLGVRPVEGPAAGPRTALRGRYWHEFGEDPSWTVGGWLDLDAPVTRTNGIRSGIGLFADVGWYRSRPRLSLEPGVELEASYGSGHASDPWGPALAEGVLRPRLYLFGDHARALKLYYELRWRQDLANDYRTGLGHAVGLRPSWTGFRRRVFVAGLVAWRSEDAVAPAYRTTGLELGVDAQAQPLAWLLLEAAARYGKYFYRQIRPRLDEDRYTLHLALGWHQPALGWLVLAEGDLRGSRFTDPDRSWSSRTVGLRIGRFF